MQCYTELTPPTAVSHSISLPFISAKNPNLIVARTSSIQIFDTKAVVTEARNNISDEDGLQKLSEEVQDSIGDVNFQRLENTTKLVLIDEYHLAGTISSLGRLKTITDRPGTESLIVAFRDAKVSVLQWDPERHSLTTISIHLYETSLSTSPWAPDISQCPCELTTDPGNRCALLRFGPRHIAIIPFKQGEDDDDYDPDLDGPREGDKTQLTNGHSEESIAPYDSSFVLSLTTINPELLFPVHLAFLHEYREPTFGVLSAVKAPTTASSLERRDVISYKVFALDLAQKASTNILSVTGLPTHLRQIVPLPPPVGGALLIGINELIHVDQSGKTTAIAVNEFAKRSSSFMMTDQSHLGLKLENCVVEQITDSGDILLIMSDGTLAIVSFVLDGRSVAGIKVYKILSTQGGSLLPPGITCSTSIARGRVFLGSEDNDAILLGWSRKNASLSRKKENSDEEELSFDEDDVEDDGDLYGTDTTKNLGQSISSEPLRPESLLFRIHDRLPNLAPISDIAFGTVDGIPSLKDEIDPSKTYMVYPNGRGIEGGLVLTRREILPEVIFQKRFNQTACAWSFHVRSSAKKDPLASGQEAMLSADAEYHQYAIVSIETDDEIEESHLYSVTSDGLEITSNGDYEIEGETIGVGVISKGTWIVQAKTNELRCYNSDFDLEQIIPMNDETTDEEFQIVRVSFCDPHVLILRNNLTIVILRRNEKSGELVEVSSPGLKGTAWRSGSFYEPKEDGSKPMLILNSIRGLVKIFELSNLKTPIYTTEAFSYLPSLISDEFAPRRNVSRVELTDVILVDIGDTSQQTLYLVLQTKSGEIAIYKPFHISTPTKKKFFKDLRWYRIQQPVIPKISKKYELYDEETDGLQKPLQVLSNVNGYSTVVASWPSPCFIIKEASSLPRVIRMTGLELNSIGSFHSEQCDQGYLTVNDHGLLQIAQLSRGYRYGDTGWPARKINFKEEVTKVVFYETHGLYAIATTHKEPFKLPEDVNNHPEWEGEESATQPLVNQGSIKLVHPINWTTINSLSLSPYEVVLSLVIGFLEPSENTNTVTPYVCAGTAILLGEDQQARGHIYVLSVSSVVPYPDRPETGHGLRVVAKEDVKGAVTALAEIRESGALLAAQGQKCFVRGLVEAGKLLPMAFLDAQCYVTVVRVLKGTGMILLGDIAKGLWFAGFTEEPYKMMVFGKAGSDMEVMATEFLPHEKQLFVLAADANKNMHVFQYDPENPKSVSGRKLLHKTTLHTGHFPISMHLLSSADKSQTAVLHTSASGPMGLTTPIDELLYLRLNTLQTYLLQQLDVVAGLNARGYRAVESERAGIKGALDGSLLRRWNELSQHRRADVCSKMGVREDDIRRDVERVCGMGIEGVMDT